MTAVGIHCRKYCTKYGQRREETNYQKCYHPVDSYIPLINSEGPLLKKMPGGTI